MSPKANVGVLIPKSFAGPMPRPVEFTKFFEAAESLGLHSLWSTERIMHRENILDTFTALTWAAAVTQRIKLGSAVVLSMFRHPLMLARAVSGLNYVSEDRFTLGLSLGGHPDEMDAMDVTTRHRVSRFEETISLLRQLWDQSDVTFHGRVHHMEGVTVAPRPASGMRTPILLGGAADSAMRRVAALADGWLASSSVVPEQLRERRDTLHRMAREVGREPSSLQIGKILFVGIDDDANKARTRLENALHAYYGPQFDVNGVCVFGPPEVCAQGIQHYLDAGVTTLMVGLTWPDTRELERLQHKVVPLLK